MRFDMAWENTSRPWKAAKLTAVAMLWTAGCSPDRLEELSASYHSERARQTLVDALETWKAGEANLLAERAAPIRFVDDDWTDGLQLVDYTFAAADSAIRPYQDVPIELVLRDASGSIVRRRAIYQVALEPHAAVLRSDH